MTTVRDDDATMTCPVCSTPFVRCGRRRHCSTACRQAAWRRRSAAPAEPIVDRADTVYQCPSCDARFLGTQRCEDCNTWARRLGPGGACPCCDEPIAVTELFAPEQFAHTPSTRSRRESRCESQPWHNITNQEPSSRGFCTGSGTPPKAEVQDDAES